MALKVMDGPEMRHDKRERERANWAKIDGMRKKW